MFGAFIFHVSTLLNMCWYCFYMLLLKVQLIQNIFNLALFKRNQLTKICFQIVIDKYNQHTWTILYLLWIYISRYKCNAHCLQIIEEQLYVNFMHPESSKSIFKYKQRNSFVHFLNTVCGFLCIRMSILEIWAFNLD